MPRATQDDHDDTNRQSSSDPADPHVLLIAGLDAQREWVGLAIARIAPHTRIETARSAIDTLLAEALRLGAPGYVLKGASAAELVAAIDSVLQGRLGRDGADLGVPGLTASSADPTLDVLSARERQILLQVVRGKSSAQIGTALQLSPKTVDSYRSRLMAKLGLADVPALVRFAIRAGLISVQDR